MSKHHWDESFSDEDYVYGETPNIFIKDKSPIILKNASVGCFAEGEGRNAVYLATLGHHVTSFDQSTVGLKKTKQLASRHNVEVETKAKDLTTENVSPQQFDAAIMVFGHVTKEDQPFFMENIINSVKHGGYVLFEVYSTDQLAYETGGPPNIEYLYEPEDILNWIKPHKCLHFYYGEAMREEGKRHTGLGHVIQVLIQIEHSL